MSGMMVAIILIKSVITVLGAGITFIAFKAFHRTKDPSLQLLAFGFGVITLGALLTGALDQVYSASLEVGVLMNSTFVAIGFGVILYSLYKQD